MVMADEKTDEQTDEQKAAEVAAANPQPRIMVGEGNDVSGFLGVAPEYMNYATPAGKPYLTEEEAYRFTTLSDDQVLATRDRDFEYENERPAVAEDTGFDFAENKKREEEAAAAREKEEGDDADKADKVDKGAGDKPASTPAKSTPAKATRAPLASNKS